MNAHVLIFSTVHHARDYLANIGACTDQEEDDEEESVEIEEGGLSRSY